MPAGKRGQGCCMDNKRSRRKNARHRGLYRCALQRRRGAFFLLRACGQERCPAAGIGWSGSFWGRGRLCGHCLCARGWRGQGCCMDNKRSRRKSARHRGLYRCALQRRHRAFFLLRACGQERCAGGGLHAEVFAEVDFAGERGSEDFFLAALYDNLPGGDDDCPLRDFQRIAHIVVGDEYADAAL